MNRASNPALGRAALWLACAALCTASAWGADPAIPAGYHLVAEDDCGNPAAQQHRLSGANHQLRSEETQGLKLDDPRLATSVRGDRFAFRYVGLRPAARYLLRVLYFNPGPARSVKLSLDGAEMHGALELPAGRVLTRTLALPPDAYRTAAVNLEFATAGATNALVSALELWSDQPGLLGPVGTYLRFRVDQLPEKTRTLGISAVIKLHRDPWQTKSFPLLPKPVSAPGLTPWVNLRKLPAGASGSLIIAIPRGARGATQFSLVPDEATVIREIGWDEPDGNKIIINPALSDIRTFRDQERRYYLQTLEIAGERLYPLARPPLMFANSWGKTTGGAAEYMVKSFRLLGLNCVNTISDLAKYERLYGWGSQVGYYRAKVVPPYIHWAPRFYEDYYRQYFSRCPPTPAMVAFQLADEPEELPIPADDAHANPGFRQWLAGQRLQPGLFGVQNWDQVELFGGQPATPEQQRRFYWSRRFQGMLTPRAFCLAADAIRQVVTNLNDVRPFVALSGHRLYMSSRLPLDMFQLAQSASLTPGISDWMTGGSWCGDSHQAVAFSVAPFNAGARRYGAGFGQAPRSFPMMHCVNPTLFRAYTMLANQCKLISYFNYGPDYEVTEGYWSHSYGSRAAVHHLNNRAAQADDILGPGRVRPGRVAMLYAMSTEYRYPPSSFADKRAAFLALAHDYFQPELVTEEQLAEQGALDHYDALFVLDRWVAAPAARAVRDWVLQGGLLWACADAASRNEYDEPSDLLRELAGLERTYGVSNTIGNLFSAVPGAAAFQTHPATWKDRPQAITWPGARVRATYGTEANPAQGPAWLEGAAGRGRLIYVGHRAGETYAHWSPQERDQKWWRDYSRECLVRPLLDAGVPRELELSAPCFVAAPLTSENGTVIVLYNASPAPVSNLVVRLREPRRPDSVRHFRQLEPADLPFEYGDGWLTMRLAGADLPREGNMMIVVRTRPAPQDPRPAAMRRAAEQHLSATNDWQTLSAGAWVAGFFPAWELAPRLESLLHHEHWAVRRSAAESLGRLGHAPAAGSLRRAVETETDAHALVDEIAALARLGHRDAPALVRALQTHRDPFRRAEGARLARLLVALPE